MLKTVFICAGVVVLFMLIIWDKKMTRVKRITLFTRWYNLLIWNYDDVTNLFELYNEKIQEAKKEKDMNAIVRLQEIYEKINPLKEEVEPELLKVSELLKNENIVQGKGLKENGKNKTFREISNEIYDLLKTCENYIVGIADCMQKIYTIDINSYSNRYFEYFAYGDYYTDDYTRTQVINWKLTHFFYNCEGKEDLKKTYKSLCKVCHPDNTETGNEELFKKINDEYTYLLKECEKLEVKID